MISDNPITQRGAHCGRAVLLLIRNLQPERNGTGSFSYLILCGLGIELRHSVPLYCRYEEKFARQCIPALGGVWHSSLEIWKEGHGRK